MKWRNQLLALFCLVLFAAFGVFYFQHWVVQKPFGIILFVGEGLAPGRMAPTRVFAAGTDVPLALDAMPHMALVTNYSNDFAAPDAAAAASTLATGMKVNNRSIGAESDGATVPTLIELARRSGRATGLVSDGKITNATAAAFYAHASDPTAQLEIARQLADASGIDLVLGGGAQDFLPDTKDGARKDGRDLLSEIRRKGFDLARTKAELEAIPGWRRPKVFGAFASGELAYTDQMEARANSRACPIWSGGRSNFCNTIVAAICSW